MFERIKAYKNLKKADKFIEGMKYAGDIMNNNEMIVNAVHALNNNKVLRKEIIFNRDKAKRYNLECKKNNLFQK